jgi:hypothetical protein
VSLKRGDFEFSTAASAKATAAFGSGTTNSMRGWPQIPSNRATTRTPPLAALASAGDATDTTITITTKEFDYAQKPTMTTTGSC